MKEQPPSKKMKPVASATMLNFIYWLVTYYPGVRDLRTLPEQHIVQLVREFEQSRPDIEKRSPEAWLESIDNFVKGDSIYDDARNVFRKRR